MIKAIAIALIIASINFVSASLAGSDTSTKPTVLFKQEKCTEIIAHGRPIKSVVAKYIQNVGVGRREEYTEIVFNRGNSKHKELRLIFLESVGNYNYTKCSEGGLTIPFGYGQLPLILNMLKMREKGDIFYCRSDIYSDLNGNEVLSGVCELGTKEKP